MLLLGALSAFNLVCAGQSALMEAGHLGPKGKPIPVSVTYRVDLNQMRWCISTCETSEAVEGFYPALLVLRRRDQVTGDDIGFETYINRESGNLVDKFMVGKSVMLITGKCEVTPFSGLPKPKF